jgi:hypothetical protein
VRNNLYFSIGLTHDRYGSAAVPESGSAQPGGQHSSNATFLGWSLLGAVISRCADLSSLAVWEPNAASFPASIPSVVIEENGVDVSWRTRIGGRDFRLDNVQRTMEFALHGGFRR